MLIHIHINTHMNINHDSLQSHTLKVPPIHTHQHISSYHVYSKHPPRHLIQVYIPPPDSRQVYSLLRRSQQAPPAVWQDGGPRTNSMSSHSSEPPRWACEVSRHRHWSSRSRISSSTNTHTHARTHTYTHTYTHAKSASTDTGLLGLA